MGEIVEKGDLVYLDYEAWIVLPNGKEELHETTRRKVAEEHGTYDEKRAYVESPFIVGHGRMLKGLEEALLGAPVGKEMEAVLPPEKGMGDRDPKLVSLMPLRELLRREINPQVGMIVDFKDKQGVVTAVTAGRVRVDFNNPLAGRTLKYRFKVAKKAETIEEKALGIIEMDYGSIYEFKVIDTGQDVDILLADACKYDEKWFKTKFKVISDLREFAGLKNIRFIEEYRKKEEKEAPAEVPKAEVPAEKTTERPESGKAELVGS